MCLFPTVLSRSTITSFGRGPTSRESVFDTDSPEFGIAPKLEWLWHPFPSWLSISSSSPLFLFLFAFAIELELALELMVQTCRVGKESCAGDRYRRFLFPTVSNVFTVVLKLNKYNTYIYSSSRYDSCCFYFQNTKAVVKFRPRKACLVKEQKKYLRTCKNVNVPHFTNYNIVTFLVF